MNVPDNYTELLEAVDYLESHNLGDDPQCVALRDILDAATRLELHRDAAFVDAALQATKERYGHHAGRDEYINFLQDNWSHYGDVEEYAMFAVDGMGETIPDIVKYHVDWDSVGRDLLDSEAGFYVFAEDGLYIFHG